MNKSVFLYVYGDDYSALGFEEKYDIQEVYESMVSEGVNKKILEDDEYYIEVEVKEFDEVDPKFIDWIQHDFCDYDDLKHSNIYQVRL